MGLYKAVANLAISFSKIEAARFAKQVAVSSNKLRFRLSDKCTTSLALFVLDLIFGSFRKLRISTVDVVIARFLVCEIGGKFDYFLPLTFH